MLLGYEPLPSGVTAMTLPELGKLLRGLRVMRDLSEAEAAARCGLEADGVTPSLTAARLQLIEGGVADLQVRELWTLLNVYRIDKEATALLITRWVVFG